MIYLQNWCQLFRIMPKGIAALKFHMIAGGPKPVAPFSHAVETDGFVFITGQMPDSPAAPGILPDGIVAQTKAVMENLRLVLNGLDLGFEHVTMARVYLTRFKEDYPAMNETYRQYFALDRLPARNLRRDHGACLRCADRD
jgi:2-iminobutanoate/2-iminopropanoate deaminase